MLKTDPKLDLTEQMLTQLIFDMKASVTDIPRIESLIFPLLKLGINKICYATKKKSIFNL